LTVLILVDYSAHPHVAGIPVFLDHKGRQQFARSGCDNASAKCWNLEGNDQPVPVPGAAVRDSGGSFILDNPDDGTPIREMLALKEGLLLVTDKCIYEVRLADQIDPTRTNPNLPHNVRRKLFNHGMASEFVCKILLQAKVLFQQNILSIDSARALELSLEALKELIAMDLGRRDYSRD
jgi:hypothetical protein